MQLVEILLGSSKAKTEHKHLVIFSELSNNDKIEVARLIRHLICQDYIKLTADLHHFEKSYQKYIFRVAPDQKAPLLNGNHDIIEFAITEKKM